MALAARPFAQIARDAANDIHPPLYYFLLRIWTRIFGMTEIALRSLSALLGVLLVLATAELGRRIFSRVTGLTAGILAAAAPFQVYYSQEVRMYILLALEAALALLLFWWWVSQEDRRLPRRQSPPDGGCAERPSPARCSSSYGLQMPHRFPLVIACQRPACPVADRLQPGLVGSGFYAERCCWA